MFTESKGDKLENVEIADLGRAEKFICRREESIVVGPKGKKSEVGKAVKALKEAVENEAEEKKKKALSYRLGMFTNTMAVIKVGAPTENEQKALKYKVEDAVNAVRAAYRNGVVAGGGLWLARQTTSSPILNEAMGQPARQLLENMGIDDPDYVDNNTAVNLVTGKRGHFLEVGVMDPVDVLLASLESAVSIASILLTSSGIIVEAQKEE
jgi:chaperonin GroEL